MFGELLRRHRMDAGLTQAELASLAGVSRQLVGAAEAGRHLPRVDAAAAIAAALGTTVEALVGSPRRLAGVTGELPPDGTAVRAARVGDLDVCAPLGSPAGPWWKNPDAYVSGGGLRVLPSAAIDAAVVVGCEPALGLAGEILSRDLLAVAASTRVAVAAMTAGRAHAAVVHGPVEDPPSAPGDVRSWRIARWRVGIAAPAPAPPWAEVLSGRVETVQREAGAGSQQAFMRAVRAAGGTVPLGPIADGHLDAAARSAATGTVSVTIEPAAMTYGLQFHALETHEARLWVYGRWTAHRGVQSLGSVLSDAGFQERLRRIGGYDLSMCGDRVGA